MQHSASDVNLTTDTLFPGKEESNRWGYGHTSLVFCGLGILVLTVVLAGAHSKVVTVGWIGLLALSVTLSIGGLLGACFSFSDRKLDKARAVFAAELAALDAHTHESVESSRETANETRLELATLAGAVRVLTNRQDELLRSLPQHMQRYSHSVALLSAGLNSLKQRVAGTEEDIAGLVTDVRGLRLSSAQPGLSLVPKKRLDPPSPGKIE